MRADVKLVEGEDGVRIVDYDCVLLILFQVLGVEYLSGANLSSMHEAILSARLID